MDINKKEAVIFVHGLWMKGPELFYLRYQVWRQGYSVYPFHYSSIFKTPEENAARLNQFISRIDEPVIHFVAHSLGGLVVSHLFNNYEINKTGKVVMIASPVNGSAVAIYLNQKKYLKYLLGKSIVKGLLGDAPDWTDKRRVCVIAGTQGLGAGNMLANSVMQEPNDGTVNLNETQLAQADESYEILRSHFTLLFSTKVVTIILQFLKK